MPTIEPFEAGFLHRPDAPTGDALALTHGASSNCNAPLLVALAEAFATAGAMVYRYNLPYRRARPHGSPFPSIGPADRAGIAEAVAKLRSQASGRVIAGGHSYGGRQTTMAASEGILDADGLLLMSYPLHPPGKPAQLRTAHFAALKIKSLFMHGARDGFGSIEEMNAALKEIPAPVHLFVVEGGGHELTRNPGKLAPTIVSEAMRFLLA